MTDIDMHVIVRFTRLDREMKHGPREAVDVDADLRSLRIIPRASQDELVRELTIQSGSLLISPLRTIAALTMRSPIASGGATASYSPARPDASTALLSEAACHNS